MSINLDRVRDLLDDVELEGADDGGPLGWVYFIICQGAPHVKIGFTKGDVQKRLKSLQTGSASELIMLVKHPGTPETERRLHERFASSRLYGEWFKATDELVAYMVQATWAMCEFALAKNEKLEPWLAAGVLRTTEMMGCCSEGILEALGAPNE